MKKAAKVFIWFGIIFQFYLIFPIVIGAVALKKINRATSKKELQNFGVVTLFFCSFLGGLFMMLIDESSLDGEGVDKKVVRYEKVDKKVVRYEKVVLSDKEMRALNGGQTAKVTRILMYSIIALSLISVILSLACITFLSKGVLFYLGTMLYEVAWITIFPGTMQALAIAIPVIMYFCSGQWAGRHCCRSLALTTPGLAAFFGIAISAACISEHALFITLTLVAFVLLVLVIVTVSLNHKMFYKTKRKVEVSKLEIELNRLTDLLKRGVIAESEYSELRAAAIRRY